jgi:nucleoside-diphosphate-sugar epimerase
MNQSDRVFGKGAAGSIGGYRVAESLTCRFQQVRAVDLNRLSDRFQLLLLRLVGLRLRGWQAACPEGHRAAGARGRLQLGKLVSARMCQHFREDYGLETRVARYHNVYGSNGTDEGGREKAPAAICGKVIEAKLTGRHEIEIWGDGEQNRSFMDIDDCLEGTQQIMQSSVNEPLNLGGDQLVTINRLVDMVEAIAGIKLQRRYKLDARSGSAGATATTP